MFRYFFTYDSEIPEGLEVKNFSPTHFIWLAVTLFLMALIILWYLRLDAKGRERFVRSAMILIIALEALREVWLLIIGHYEMYRHLPLHLCGTMIFIEAGAVFFKKPFCREFSYAVGLPGALMALLTPEPSGYPLLNIQYLQSIAIHALIALIPLLWIIGGEFRPNIRMLPKNFALLLGLAAFCFGINFPLKSNYMFVRFAPADTPIALFDSWVGWPGYIVLLLFAVFLFFIIMYLPWEIAARAKAKGQSAA